MATVLLPTRLSGAATRGRGAVAPIWQAAKGALSAVRPLGWTAIGAAVASLALGVPLGWAEARLFGIGLLALAALCALFTIGRSPYEVSMQLARARVRRGERANGRILVRNASSRATFPASLELPVGTSSAEFALPRLAGGKEHEELFAIPTSRRCVIEVGPVISARGDSLGLFRREVTWTGAQELFVHPDTVTLGSGAAGVLRDLEGQPSRDLASSDVAFHALRDYVPGDDVRHIAWKSLAKTGRLLVRQFEETRRSHAVLMLPLRDEDFAADDDEFELAVSACASVSLQALKEEKDVTVLTGRGTAGVANGTQVLDDLSRIERGESRASIQQLAGRALASVPGASLAMFFIGSSVPPSAIRAAAARLPIDARRFAVRCELGSSPSRRSVGDSTVITIGALDHLPGALFAVGA